jgi:hypothetical protein
MDRRRRVLDTSRRMQVAHARPAPREAALDDRRARRRLARVDRQRRRRRYRQRLRALA